MKPHPIRHLVRAYYARKRRKEMDALYEWARHYYLLGDFDLANQLLHDFYEMQKAASHEPQCFFNQKSKFRIRIKESLAVAISKAKCRLFGHDYFAPHSCSRFACRGETLDEE